MSTKQQLHRFFGRLQCNSEKLDLLKKDFLLLSHIKNTAFSRVFYVLNFNSVLEGTDYFTYFTVEPQLRTFCVNQENVHYSSVPNESPGTAIYFGKKIYTRHKFLA